MIRPRLLLLSLTVSPILALAQQELVLDPNNGCSYDGRPLPKEKIYSFKSSAEAVDLIQQIVDAVGLKPNFEINAANVANARAVVIGTTRRILYSESFIQQIDDLTKSKWASISILAHEVGHHLNGHTLDSIGSRPSLELEADEFSGFVLGRMGATLEEAQSAITAMNPIESTTHPGKAARLEAIAVGWRRGSKERIAPTTTGPVNRPPGVGSSKVQQPPQSGSAEPCGSQVGSYCFKNNSNETIRVDISNRPAHLAVPVISPGGEECYYDLSVGSYSYQILSYDPNFNPGPFVGGGGVVLSSGMMRIVPCQTGTKSYPK